MLEEAQLLEEDYESSGKRSWGTSITVDGTVYATSLFWQPLQNSSDPFQEVEEASAGVLEGADLFCIKGGKAPQFGICVSHEGYRSGESVGAVSLATALSNISSYVAVFKTPEGWWYTCIRNDIILSDGDMLFLDEEEAKNQFTSMLAVPDWGKKIAPAEWGIEDTEEMDLGEILARGAKSKLQKIKGLRGTKLLLVVVISAVVGLWLISSLVDRLFLTPTVKPVVVPVKPKVIQKKQVQAVVEVKPWEKMKDPKHFMTECYKGTNNLISIMPPGWDMGEVSCTDGGIATVWKRSIGRINWAKKALNESELPFSGYSFSTDGNTLTAALPIPPSDFISSAPEAKGTDLLNHLNDKFQAMGLPVSLGIESRTSQGGAVYKKLIFSLKSNYNPTIWMEILTKYSGLEINTIHYNPGDNTWSYKGAIYVL